MKNKPAEKPIHEKCAQAILEGMPPLQSEKQATEVRRLCEIYFLEAEAKNKLESLSGIENFLKRCVNEVDFVWHYVASKLQTNPEVVIRDEISKLPLSFAAATMAEILTRYFDDAKELAETASVDS